MVDEATMLDCYQLEALDRTLRDVMEDEHPFGSKTIVLSGDIRQCLPGVPGASRVGIVDKLIINVWPQF